MVAVFPTRRRFDTSGRRLLNVGALDLTEDAVDEIDRIASDLISGFVQTRNRDRLAIVNATGDSFLKRVAGLHESRSLVHSGRETFGKVSERDDDLARVIGLKPCGIAKLYLEPFRPRYSSALLKIRVLTLSLR